MKKGSTPCRKYFLIFFLIFRSVERFGGRFDLVEENYANYIGMD